MTLTLELPPEVEARLADSAAQAATTAEACAVAALQEWLEREAAEDAADVAVYDAVYAEMAASGEKPIPLAEALAMNKRERLAL